jgi:uncharacterized protein YjiS (DUF1127 family)
MLKIHASQNVNRVVGPQDPRNSGAVRAMPLDSCNIAGRAPAAESGSPKSDPAAISTVAGAGYTLVSLWLSVLASFVEGYDAYLTSRAMTADHHQQGNRLSSQNSNVIRSGEISAPTSGLPRRWNSSASPYDGAVTLWDHWRREREIKKAVAALAQFDERTLRDMGISSRSEIEQAVRFCHDC